MSKALKLSHRKTGGGTSVEEWGVGGDGKVNETLKIQNALDNFQHVYFPPGTYLVDGSLTASLDKQVIEGAGKGSVIKMMASKTYDLTQPHAALTMNAGEQTLQDLQLIGPDTGDDSNFSGSGSDWYNLAALRVDAPSSNVNEVNIDRCEGVGMTLSRQYCNVQLCQIQRTGLDGVRTTIDEQRVLASRFTDCTKTTYSNISTYPSSPTTAVHFLDNDCIVSECHFINNTRDITCNGEHHVICNNQCWDGVHVAARETVVSNNLIRSNSGNALTVANDGSSYINSLVGNDIRTMDQGGANDIISPSSYGVFPVKKAAANENPDIDRIYQQRAHAFVPPNDASNNADGSVPLNSPADAQLIDVNASNDSFTVVRTMLVQITMPTVNVVTEYQAGWLYVTNEDTGSNVASAGVYVCYNNTSGDYFTAPTSLQTRLQPNTVYKLYMLTSDKQTAADLTYDADFGITIADIE